MGRKFQNPIRQPEPSDNNTSGIQNSDTNEEIAPSADDEGSIQQPEWSSNIGASVLNRGTNPSATDNATQATEEVAPCEENDYDPSQITSPSQDMHSSEGSVSNNTGLTNF